MCYSAYHDPRLSRWHAAVARGNFLERMFRMKTERIHQGLVVLLTAWLFPAAALAAGTTVTGVIGSLSPATRTVAIQMSDGTQVMLRATGRTVLTRNGRAVGFAALALRDQAAVQLQGSALVRLDAHGPALDSARGVFTGFDATSQLLTMATLHGTRSFRVGTATLIERNGAPTTAQGLARGDALLVHPHQPQRPRRDPRRPPAWPRRRSALRRHHAARQPHRSAQ